ncbi:MAG: 50S ribosomal protein L24 [Clostridia bacterium]|nr:50S ribosomal protein L24 [Clostridia bacterium]
MNKLHVKTGDTVVVISGKDKGTVGKVIAAAPEEGKVMVEKVNMVSKHMKARKQGDVSSIIKAEGAIYASKVQLYCPKCEKGVKVKTNVSVDKNGKKVKTRICKKCGAEI